MRQMPSRYLLDSGYKNMRKVSRWHVFWTGQLRMHKMQLRIGFDEWDRWWQADPDLRTIILGESFEGDEPDATTTDAAGSLPDTPAKTRAQ